MRAAAALALYAAAGLACADPAPRPALMAPLAPQSTLLGLAVAGERLVAVGQRGHILVSADGHEWTQVAVPVNAMLNRVRFRDAKAGWAVGHDATILATTDGGATWTLQHFDPEGRPLYDLIFLDDGRIAAIGGYGSYLVSAGDGARWEPRSFPVADLGQHFNAVARLNDGSLLIAGERGLLARSDDDGETWQLLDSPYTGSWFGVLPAGEHGALVFGLRGNLYLAADVTACPTLDPAGYDAFTRETVPDAQALAKTGWRPLERPTLESLFSGARDGDGAVLVGVNGVIVRVDPAAGTATRVDTPARETLNDVLRHGDRWLAVGRRGIQDLGALP
ncbi:MAG: WD40/YVTN/BNR-like repeat-containing protein [Nevskiaceae bacterium]